MKPDFRKTLINLANKERQRKLAEDPELNKRAAQRASDLCNQYPAKNFPKDHAGFADYFKGTGKPGENIRGENLAWDQPTPEVAHKQLMNSPKHKENIMKKIYSRIGVGRSDKCDLNVELFAN
jgi:uncharacterized protein YkwD